MFTGAPRSALRALRHYELVANLINAGSKANQGFRQATVLIAGHGAAQNDGWTFHRHPDIALGTQRRGTRQYLLYVALDSTRSCGPIIKARRSHIIRGPPST